jgi:hypothetical protein
MLCRHHPESILDNSANGSGEGRKHHNAALSRPGVRCEKLDTFDDLECALEVHPFFEGVRANSARLFEKQHSGRIRLKAARALNDEATRA